MKATVQKAICVGIRPPRPYSFNGREGVSYAVEITDGNGAVELPVIDLETYSKFDLMKKYDVDIEFTMVAQSTNNNGARMFPRCRIVSCHPAN